MTERILSEVQLAEMGYLRRVRGVTLHVKVRSLENSQNIERRSTAPPNREISAMLVRPCVQNAQRKFGEASPAGYTFGIAAQSSSKDQVA